MGAREKIENKIQEKQNEIWRLKASVRDAESFVRGLEEAMSLLPREPVDEGPITLRPGTIVDTVRLALVAKGIPMHITDLLKAVGKSDDNDSRASLSGSISAYVRKNQIFTRPAPNTFGLIDFPPATPKNTTGPPPNFGSDKTEEESDGDETELTGDDAPF